MTRPAQNAVTDDYFRSAQKSIAKNQSNLSWKKNQING
jgi:hypothetical protein